MNSEEFEEREEEREKRDRYRLYFGLSVAIVTLAMSTMLGGLLIWHLYVDTPFDVKVFEQEHEEQSHKQGMIIDNQQVIMRNQQIIIQQLIGKHCVNDDFWNRP